MLPRLFNTCLLRPSDLPPSREDLEVIGVFNPGAIATNDGVVLLVRVAERPKEHRPGYIALPRWDPLSNKIVVDWAGGDELGPRDQRLIKPKKEGPARLTFVSHLRVIHSRNGRTIDSISGARLEPANKYEEFGVEDPRITRIGETFFITYVAVSRHGAATALASTADFKTFQRHGIIFCPENKDVVLFPEKIGGNYFALHRPSAGTFTKPEMWLATSPDLIHWGHHEQFLGGGETWDIGRVGGGAPPIRRPEGWLVIYHGNSRREEDLGIGTYSSGLLLLDLENPRRILGQSGQILLPQTDYEYGGFVPNVVFPTGIVEQGETVLVYYGAADTSTAVVEFSVKDLLHSLKGSGSAT
jgi:predicted GH43/DUF377 family glycosyl hydrolase